MNGRFSRWVATYPLRVLVLLALLTVAFGSGLTLSSQAGSDAGDFLPGSNRAVDAQARIAATFGTGTQGPVVQVITRGDVLDPAALAFVADGVRAIAADPVVAPVLASDAPLLTHVMLLSALTGTTDPSTLPRARIEGALTRARPEQAGLVATVDSLVARDGDSRPIGSLSVVSLRAGLDLDARTEASLAAEAALARHQTEAGEKAPVRMTTFSDAKMQADIGDEQGSTMTRLMGFAIFVIIAVLVLFYRAISDVLLTLGGLLVTIVWVFGLQGLLGPGGLDVTGGQSPLSTMIPVLLIGLCVDFAMQVTSRYRQCLAEGLAAAAATAEAVRATIVPLALAAGTTSIAFATNLGSSLPPMRDFGVVAALGVASGLVVMTTLVPASRVLLDTRRARRGKTVNARRMADAIPGAERVLTAVATGAVRRPLPILAATAALAVAAGAAAFGVGTTFDESDFLPEGTDTYNDIVFLSESFGGGASSAAVLLEGPLEDRFIRDLIDLETALAGEQRPEGVTGPPSSSVLTLISDYASDSGLPGDRYDAAFAGYLSELELGFVVTPATLGEIIERVRSVDSDAFDQVMVLDGGRVSALVSVPIAKSTPGQIERVVADLEDLWRGEADQIAVTGPDVLAAAVTDELVSSQARSVVLTIVAALVVLVLYFGVSSFRPILGVLAVAPIAMVVLFVLGTMYVLDISYNVITALITALVIGVGVDYTVHVTHRFLDELHEEDGDVEAAMARTMSTTGAALVGSALTTALGFGVLVFAPLEPLQQFGLLTAVTVIYSLLAAFVILPPMLTLWAAYSHWRHHRPDPVTAALQARERADEAATGLSRQAATPPAGTDP